MKKVVIYVILAISLLHAYGSGGRVSVKFQSIQNGLSNRHIKCIVKDHKGFIWFGTSEGLNKFDGSNFTLYEKKVNDGKSLINNNVTAILEDSNRNLWIGTAVGLCIYNRETDGFESFKNFGEEDFHNISALFEDVDHNIWIGTSGHGVFVYNPAIDTIFSYSYEKNNPTSVSSNFINSIISDQQNRIWLGTRNGLDLYDKRNNIFLNFANLDPTNDVFRTLVVRSVILDPSGSLWVGTYGKGLFKLTDGGKNWHVQQYVTSENQGSLSSNDILSLLCDKKGNIWIGTENGGLDFLPSYSSAISVFKTQDGNPQSISSNSIWSLYQDNTGIIWVGTYNQGLNYIDERSEKFSVFQKFPFESNTLVNNNVLSFSSDKNGTIWIATDGGGVSSFDPQTDTFTNKINNESISSKAGMVILCDSKQRIWVGTWGGGLDVFDITGKKIKNFKLEAYNRVGNILSLYEDRQGNIWVGSAGNGLLLFDEKTNNLNKITDETGHTHLSDNAFINTILQDSEGTYWIGIPYSLIRMKIKDGITVFTEYRPGQDSSSISSAGVITVFEDSRHRIWIGTDDGLNLFHKENETFTKYRKEDGLPHNTINAILEDRNNSLWISTFGGLSKFDTDAEIFKNYNREDGLRSNSFNPRSCLKTANGEFYFGNNNGFVRFSPDSIIPNTYVPPVYFTAFSIFNKPAEIGAKGSPLKKHISETKKVTLNYKQTSFTIEFVALNFTHASKNQYAYMLEGFDNNWIDAGTKKFATYTNIDAGKYIFKVKGANNEGLWNPEPIQLEIVVLPPFWKTIWAYLFYIAFIVGLLWVFINLLIIKRSQAEKLRLEQIHREKGEELNMMKIQFFTNISHEFRTPLSLIIAPLKQIIKQEPLGSNLKQRIEMVYNNANKLYELVNELMDFSKSGEGSLRMLVQKTDFVVLVRNTYNLFIEEAKQREIDFSFETFADQLDVWIDKSKMEKIIVNLLSNAFKFTQNQGRIAIKIATITENGLNYATLSVTDNGSGISPEYIDHIFDRFYQTPEADNKYITGTGIGLALVKSLAELHHGNITVESEKWKETRFTLSLPLGNKHFKTEELMSGTGEYYFQRTENKESDLGADKKNLNANAPLLLIVEDNTELRNYLASILSPYYQLLAASDGAEGLKMAQESIPDLILSDIAMPKLSGIELCRILKNEMPTSHIPIILLTAKTAVTDKIEGIETGADTYITKPFDVDHLKVTIQKTIETRRKLYQRFSQDIYLIPNENSENELDRKFLEQIIAYIDKNASDSNITVENMAAHLLMSRTNIYRKIKALTGQTATEFIRNTRLKMAVKLIEGGQHNISEIAFQVGFSSPGYFAKCFKEKYGKAPSEFILAKIKH